MEERFYNIKSKYGRTYEVCFQRASYYDGSGAVTMMCKDPDMGGAVVPYANLTVNICPLGSENLMAVDSNNLGDHIVDFLEENGIAAYTGQTVPSGYCEYPVMSFSQEWLDSLPRA